MHRASMLPHPLSVSRFRFLICCIVACPPLHLALPTAPPTRTPMLKIVVHITLGLGEHAGGRAWG